MIRYKFPVIFESHHVIRTLDSLTKQLQNRSTHVSKMLSAVERKDSREFKVHQKDDGMFEHREDERYPQGRGARGSAFRFIPA